MEQDEGASSIRHVLEPLGQSTSLLGGIDGTEAEPAGLPPGRASRGAGRLGACLAVSLALHAVVLALVPAPGPRGRWTAPSEVRVTLVLRGGDPAPSGGIPAAPDAAAPRLSSPAPQETPPHLPERGIPGSPDLADPSAGSGAFTTPPPAAGGPGGSDRPSASDQAAALLLARVEAALVYPDAARRRGTEGLVRLKIYLDDTGALSDLKVARSSGSALLDRAAREAVAVCLPVPNPSGAPLTFELAVRFTLKKAAAP